MKNQSSISSEQIKAVDLIVDSPEERTNKVHNYLQANKELSHWDIFCFCAAYLKWTAMQYPFMYEPARTLATLVRHFHYTKWNELGLDKKENGILEIKEDSSENESLSGADSKA